MIRGGLRALWALWALTLAGGFLGALHPAGDSLAVGRLQVLTAGAILLAGLLAAGMPRLAGLTAVALLLAGGATWAAWRGGAAAGEGAFALYQKNLLYVGGDRTALIADIRAADPDLITLQEAVAGDPDDDAMLAGLADRWPHQLRCRSNAVGDVAILSRHAFLPGSTLCDEHDSHAVARLVLPGAGEVTVVALHLAWPWPFRQAGQLAGLRARLDGLAGPVIVAGDFNMQPWGRPLGLLARSAGAVRVGGYGTTYARFGPLAPVIIDHVLLPAGWQAQAGTRPEFGSDHRGVVARFGPG